MSEESNIQWLFDAIEYMHSKKINVQKDDQGFYLEFCWLYVDMQYGHDENGEIIKYG